MASKTSFNWNMPQVDLTKQRMMKGMLAMGADIASKARYNAPYLTGALRNSIRVTAEGDKVYVLAGGSVAGARVDYALLREYQNKKHPSTTHYMKRAFDTVANGNIQQYFGGVR